MNRLVEDDDINGSGLDAAVDALSGALGKGAKVDKKSKVTL